MKTTIGRITNNLHIVWTITSKDILDSIKSKLILSLIIGMSFMLLTPKMMSMIIVSPYTDVMVYDPGDSLLLEVMNDSDLFNVQRVNAVAELEQVIGSMGFGLGAELGLVVPADFNQVLETGGKPEIAGYIAWANRIKASQLVSDTEDQLSELMDQPVSINTTGNIVYPPPNLGLLLGMVTITIVLVLFMMGINLVPTLLFEEKRTKTMEALLVSPASIGQVVIGKALAGFFYIIVTAAVVFAIYGSGVVHWEVAALFVIDMGIIAVAVGLVLGSFFESQQEVTGWMMLLMVVVVGSLFIKLLGVEIPSFLLDIISWLPSVTMAEVFSYSFVENIPWTQIWPYLGSVLGISVPLYILVAWKISRLDR
jgi:ABC-2 type transport system permease protein